MTERFELLEKSYRAVYPPEIMPLFWKENGEISFVKYLIVINCTYN